MSELILTHPTVVTGRSDLDFFPTPRWCTLALLRFGNLNIPRELHALDPAREDARSPVLDEAAQAQGRADLEQDRARGGSGRLEFEVGMPNPLARQGDRAPQDRGAVAGAVGHEV